jgi:histidinol phosphatase-like enzyme (inositol monophosphatase family)
MSAGRDRHTDEAEFLLALARVAGAAILPWFRGALAIDNKDEAGFDPVTEADRAAERAMRRMIERRYPGDGIVGEEYGEKPSQTGRRWVLDPVDGTRSFICGLPTWMTLVGLVEDERPVAGAAHQAFIGETFIGGPAGAFVVRRGRRRPLATSPAASLSAARGGTTNPMLYRQPSKAPVYEALRTRLRNLRHDADAYFFCMVAAGQMDLAIDTGLKVYDIAALIPIIEAAGGRVTTWTGAAAGNGGDILATASPALHDEALGLIGQAAGGPSAS